MQRILFVIAVTSGLLTSVTQAQDSSKPNPGPKKAPPAEHAGEHVERAGEELKQAGKVAGEQARDAVHKAGSRAGETLREAKEGASEALEEAKAAAAESAEEAEAAAKEAREKARSGMENARDKAASFFENAREHVRRALLNAAEGLESDKRKEEREASRKQRQDAARAEQWRVLREQLDAPPTEEEGIAPDLSQELRLHAQRTARLSRIRAVADREQDTRSVKRCDELLAKELARHEQRMTALLTKTPANSGEGSAQAPKENQR